MIRYAITFVVTFASFVLAGCASVSNLSQGVFFRVQEHHEMSEIRQDTRQALAEEHLELQRMRSEARVEQARNAALRRQLEQQFCEANCQAERDRIRSNIRETLASKIAFNVEHGIEVGELEVDENKLKDLLRKREKQRQKDREREELEERKPPRRSCCNCDNCRCKCGYIKKFCPICRHLPCGCKPEPNCGGPRDYERLSRQPVRRLKPTEIPLMLPVRLTFGMDQPEIEESRVKREPIFTQPVRLPCDACDDREQSSSRRLRSSDLPPVPEEEE